MPPTDQTASPLFVDQSVDVRELQARAEDAIRRRARARRHAARRPLSRRARLLLIDQLSRRSGPALAVVAGTSVFLAAVVGREEPARAALWLAMVFAALFAARSLRRGFRDGERIAGRPFRWRADYTSSLSVLGAAFGAGALILSTPVAAAAIALAAAACVGFHAVHGRAALAVALPAGALTLVGGAGAYGPQAALFGFAAFWVLAICGAYLLRRRARAAAARRFPRTRLAARGASRRTGLAPAALADARTA